MITRQEKLDKIKEFLGGTRLDPLVTKRTIGHSASSISGKALLKASEKLLAINKGTAEPDDRDNLRFSSFHGIEDYVKDHVEKDDKGVRMRARNKIQQKKNLSWLHSGFFSPQIRSTIVSNPLGQNMEGINPLEHVDVSGRVTKLGPGGIPSIDSVPEVSRNVSPSSFGFFDPLHMQESLAIGVTNYLTHNVAKGKDNKLYRVMKDKNGKLKWVSHEEVLNSKVRIPEH